MNILFKPHPGAQTRFMAFKGRYALIGGAAGGGKSDCLLYDPFRQIQIDSERIARGEIQSSSGRAIFFRRTMPELREVMDRAHRVFPLIDPGAKWHEQTKTWTFYCGYKYLFGQMEEPGDWMKYYSFEFTWCVEVGTRVRMADGSLWPIEKIRPGDMVLTLEGPRPVVALSAPRMKPCIRAVVSHRGETHGEQVHPEDHPLLTIASSTTIGKSEYTQANGPGTSSTLSWLSYESLLSAYRGSPAEASSSEDGRTDCGGSGDSLPAPQRPVTLSVPVVLHVPLPWSAAQQMGAAQYAATPLSGTGYGQQQTQTHADFQGGYQSAHGSHGGQLLHAESAARASFQQQGHVAEHIRSYWPGDAPSLAQKHSRPLLGMYAHPYTGEERPVSADLAGDLVYGACDMTPIGPRSVVDITIAGASHYITECGLINRNCGFDEATTFTEEQFDQIDTRVRSADPVLSQMLYVRLGTNPVGPGLEWVRRRFVEVAKPNTPVIVRIKTPITENGQTRYETVERQQIFIPARLGDNPSINQKEYAATLTGKSAATRRALLEGDWYANTEGAWVGDDWDQDIHICEPFKIPTGWPKSRCGDYGYSWPGLASIQWVATDTDGNGVVYRSLTTSRQNAEMLAYRIKEIEMDAGEWDIDRGCSKLRGPLDSSCWSQTGAIGPTIAESFFNVGVIWDKCDKNREAAAEQMRQRLVRRTAHPTLKDENGKPEYCIPGIRWFSTCYSYVLNPRGNRVKTGPIVTIPVLPADENQPDVPDTKANDHDYDGISYWCLSRPLTADNANVHPDELRERRKKQRESDRSFNKLGYPTGAW